MLYVTYLILYLLCHNRSDSPENVQLADNNRWKLTTPHTFSYLIDQANHPKAEIIRVVTIHEPPFMYRMPVDDTEPIESYCGEGKICWQYNTANDTVIGKRYCCFGLLIDLLNRIETDLTLISNIYMIEDRFYGSQINGTWNGLIGDLVNNKADLALAILTINAERSNFVDFSEPFFRDTIAIATLERIKSVPFLNINIFHSFQAKLWLAIVLVTLSLSVLLYLVENGISCLSTYAWFESISYLTGLLFQRDVGGQNPKRFSSRVMSISIAVATTVLMSAYIALLTANLVDTETQWIVTGIEDEKITTPDTSFTYGIIANSSFLSFFRDTKLPMYQKLYQSSNKYEYQSITQGIEMLISGQLQAIIDDNNVLLEHACKTKITRGKTIRVISDQVELYGIGLALQKGSPLTSKLTESLRNYVNRNFIEELKVKWSNYGCREIEEKIQSQAEFKSFGGAFMILFIGIALSAVVLTVEWCYIYVIIWVHQRFYS